MLDEQAQETPDVEATSTNADATADGGGADGKQAEAKATGKQAEAKQPEEPRFTQDDLNKLVGKTRKEEREKARRALLEELGVSDPADVKKALAEYNELKKAQMTAEERMQAELEEARQKAQQAETARRAAEQAAQERLVQAELVAEAALLGFADPRDAVTLISASDLKFDEGSGRLTNAGDVVKALAEKKPYLLRQDKRGTPGPTNPSRDAKQGRTDDDRRAEYFRGVGRDCVFDRGNLVLRDE